MDSSVWWWIALGIVVVALIIGGIGVGLFISGMKEPMKEIKGSADNLKERMENLKLETTSLQHRANELKEDMQVKSEKVTLFIDAAKGAKNSALDLNASVRAITGNVASKVHQDKRKNAEVDYWSNSAMNLLTIWKDWKDAENREVIYLEAEVSENNRP